MKKNENLTEDQWELIKKAQPEYYRFYMRGNKEIQLICLHGVRMLWTCSADEYVREAKKILQGRENL